MTRQTWDVIVIGAGPAGSMAAREAARSGASVLLLDKRRFPRDKVCGCCVNGAAAETLKEAGLGSLLGVCGAASLASLHVRSGHRRAKIPLPDSWSLSRALLDTTMVEAAVKEGVEFRDGQAAHIRELDGTGRNVMAGHQQVLARCVILATGLGARTGGEMGLDEEVRTVDARIGLSAISDARHEYPDGTIHMACGTGGYVGLVRLEDGRLNIAAAIDPGFVRAAGGPTGAVETILTSCELEPPYLREAIWHGTPLLTRRRRRVAAERLLVVGDAAGYIEPFTGEGIAWALAGGRAAGKLSARPWHAEIAPLWTRQVAALRRRQWVCRGVTAGLRAPGLVEAVLSLCALVPSVARPVLSWINRPVPIIPIRPAH